LRARYLFTPKEKEAGIQVFALIPSSIIALSDSNSYLTYNLNPRLNCTQPKLRTTYLRFGRYAKSHNYM